MSYGILPALTVFTLSKIKQSVRYFNPNEAFLSTHPVEWKPLLDVIINLTQLELLGGTGSDGHS